MTACRFRYRLQFRSKRDGLGAALPALESACGCRLDRGSEADRRPAASIPFFASGVDMTASQTEPLRTFSAINSMLPWSIPIASRLYQPSWGWKASMNPYLDQALEP